jgi:hypothetical protein
MIATRFTRGDRALSPVASVRDCSLDAGQLAPTDAVFHANGVMTAC